MSNFLTRSYDGPDFDAIGRKFEDFKRKLQGLQAQVRNLTARTPLHFYSATGTATDGNYNNDGATGVGAYAIGVRASAGGQSAVAIGNDAVSGGRKSIAIGDLSTDGNNSTLIGGGSDKQAMINGDAAGGVMLIGRGIQNYKPNNLLISRNATCRDAFKVTQVGYRSDTQIDYPFGNHSTGVGVDASAVGADSVAIGSYAVATEALTVSFGNTKAEQDAATGNTNGRDRFRRVVNIADGVNAHDAVTVAQLGALSEESEAALTWATGWRNYGGGYALHVIKRAGVVYIYGISRASASFTAPTANHTGVSMFTLPEGFRPRATLDFWQAMQAPYRGAVRVNSNGAVHLGAFFDASSQVSGTVASGFWTNVNVSYLAA